MLTSLVNVARTRLFFLVHVADPPLFRAAPDVRCPGADSGQWEMGPALAFDTNIFHFELWKSELLIFLFIFKYQICLYKLNQIHAY